MRAGAYPMPGDGRVETRLLAVAEMLAARRLHPAAFGELAARGKAGEVRHVPLDGPQPPLLADVTRARDGIEEAVRVGVLSLVASVEDVPGRPLVHHSPGVHHRHPVGDAAGHPHDMRAADPG